MNGLKIILRIKNCANLICVNLSICFSLLHVLNTSVFFSLLPDLLNFFKNKN